MSNFSQPPGEQTVEAGVRPEAVEELLVRYQSSDPSAGSLLVLRLSTPVFRYFLGQVRNRERAEDLLQDFWLRVHNARHTYRPGEPALPWLYAIAHRVKVDDYRRTRRHLQHEPLQDYAAPSPAQPEANITQLLAQLPAAQREAVLLMKVNGLSLEEVARATGASVGAVKQRVHRAYEKLRSLLGGTR